MSRKGKKVQTEKVETIGQPDILVPVEPPEPEPKIEEPTPLIKDEFDEIFPDDTDEVSLDDAARVLDVSVPVAKLWLLHGHMTSVGTKGFVRVSRESVRTCWKRFIAGKA